MASKDIFIIVGHKQPVGDAYFLLHDENELDEKYEAMVVMTLFFGDDTSARNLYRFDGTRYARQGGGYKRWWQ